jgi:hypothetical protein
MHKKSRFVWKKLAAALSTAIVAASMLVAGAPTHASGSAPALTFIPRLASGDEIDLHGFGVGEGYYFLNIDGQGTRAKYEVLAVQNLISDDDNFTNGTWQLDWTEFTPHGDAETVRVRWKLEDGSQEEPWVYDPPLTAPGLATNVNTRSLALPIVDEEDRYKIEIVAFDDSVSPTVPMTAGATTLYSFTKSNSPGVNRAYFGPTSREIEDVVDRLDKDDTDDEDFLLESIIRSKAAGEMSATLKISFEREVNGVWSAYAFPYLSMNFYDFDISESMQIENVSTYQVLPDNNIQQISQVGAAGWRFLAKDTGLSNDTGSKTIGRIMVNFVNASSVEFTYGRTASGSGSTSNFDLDFSAGLDFGGEAWTTSSGPAPVVPQASFTAASPVMAAIDVNPTNITVDSEIITILGANLNTVTDVFIGGVRVPIFYQTGNRLQIRAPQGLSGAVDLELKSSLNDVLMTKKLTFGEAVAATGTKKRTLVVGGFAPNSRKLTARMKNRIDRWLDRHSDLSTLTCTGFTSLPRRTTDVTLSTNRGKTACNFSKRQRAELETSVSQGIEDPRPGSNVRRVRLVLTP